MMNWKTTAFSSAFSVPTFVFYESTRAHTVVRLRPRARGARCGGGVGAAGAARGSPRARRARRLSPCVPRGLRLALLGDGALRARALGEVLRRARRAYGRADRARVGVSTRLPACL